MNRNRLTATKHLNTKNTLVERCNDNIINFDLITDDNTYNEEIEVKFKKTINFLNNTKQVKKYQVLMLYASINQTTKQIAETLGAKERQVIYQNVKLKQLIKQNVK